MKARTATMFAAGCALALTLSACGSSKEGGDSPVAAPATSNTIATTTAGDAVKTAALLEAAVRGDTAKVKQLMADGARPDLGVAQTLVYADADDPSLITAMLAAGLDPDITDPITPEHTILMWTGEIGHPKMAKALLDRGSDIDKVDAYGDPAVSVAAFNGHLDVVKLLVARGAALNLRGLGDFSAVGHAKRAGHPRIAAFLVSKGAPE
jgi:ankyrin repeat protein